MRISSKKILAVVLSVAMLMSCMVFSFSSTAATGGNWANAFEDPDATGGNWANVYDDTSNAYDCSGNALHNPTAGLDKDGKEGGGAMVLSIDNTNVATGFRVFADSNTKSNCGGEGTVTDAKAKEGRFKLTAGEIFTVNFDYKVNKLESETETAKLYVAAANKTIYWVNNNTYDSTHPAIDAVTLGDDRIGEWQKAKLVIANSIKDSVHIYAVGDVAVTAEVVIDNVVVDYAASSKITFVHNGDYAGQTGVQLENTVVDPESFIDIPAGYKAEFYEDEALTKQLTTITHSKEDDFVYIKLVKDPDATPLYTETYDREPFTAQSSFSKAYGDHTTDLHQYSGNNNTLTALRGNSSGRVISKKYKDTKGITQAFTDAYTDNPALTVLHSGEYYYKASNGSKYASSLFLAPKAGYSYTVTFDVLAEANMTVEAGLAETRFVDSGVAVGNYYENKTEKYLTAETWDTMTVTLSDAQADDWLVLGIASKDHHYAENAKPEGISPVIHIDNVKVYEYAPAVVTVADPKVVQSFEDDAFTDEQDLLNSNHAYDSDSKANITTAVKRTGEKSVYVYSDNNSGGNRAHFNIPSIDGNGYMTAEKGTQYEVTFWVYSDKNNPTTELRYWLAAAEKDLSFEGSGTTAAQYAFTDKIVEIALGCWNKVTFVTSDPDNDVYSGGVMRLGIAGGSGGHTFYIDDISVKAVETSDNDNVWSFENEAADTVVDSYSGKEATVSGDYAYTGTQSMRIVSATGHGRARAQIYLKKADGTTPIYVKEGQEFLVSFWAYVPDDAVADFSLNMWFAASDGSSVRPYPSGSGNLSALFFDDQATPSKILQRGAGWTMIVRKVKVDKTITAGKDQLLMSIGDQVTANNNTIYIDDISVVDLSKNELDKSERGTWLFKKEINGKPTHLHTYYDPTGEKEPREGAFTSVRLGATYRSTKADGSTMILDGVVYDVVERGILVGTSEHTLANYEDTSTFKWKAFKNSTTGYDSFKNDAVGVAAAPDQYDITHTLRLANMDSTWFDANETNGQTMYHFRSYYKLQLRYVEKTQHSYEYAYERVVYGEESIDFNFADQFNENVRSGYWFSDLNPES